MKEKLRNTRARSSRHLGAQPNRHIATLAQAFIVVRPVRNPIPLLLELVPPRVIEFMRHQRHPIDQERAALTEPAGSVQQRPPFALPVDVAFQLPGAQLCLDLLLTGVYKTDVL